MEPSPKCLKYTRFACGKVIRLRGHGARPRLNPKRLGYYQGQAKSSGVGLVYGSTSSKYTRFACGKVIRLTCAINMVLGGIFM